MGKVKNYSVVFEKDGRCTLISKEEGLELIFDQCSSMLNFCRERGIDITIEDCVTL